MKPSLFIAARPIFAVLSLSGMLALAAEEPKPINVKAVHPARGNITRYVTLPGTIRANQQATLYAKVAGYLKSLTVDKGDRVETGQSLGEIEVPELLADVAKYQAEVKVADLDVERVNKAQNKAPDLVMPESVDQARGRLEIAKANLQRTQTLLSYAKITASFSGIVTARYVDPGAFIPAATSGTAAQTAAIVTVSDFNIVRAQVPVPEAEASHTGVGQPVKFTVSGLSGKTFETRISRISYALDDATRTMSIEADLPNPDLLLRPGMYATVKLGLETHTNALLIPAGAVVWEKAAASVFTITAGRAKKIPVKTGFNDGESVEILDGLTASQPVVLAGRATLNDGQPVNGSEGEK